MRAMMLQHQLPDADHVFRRVAVCGPAADAAALLAQAAPAIGGPDPLVRLLISSEAARVPPLEPLLSGLERRGVRIEYDTGVGMRALLRQAQEQRFDLVLKGVSPRPGDGGMALTGEDRRLLDRCPCPLWLGDPVRPHPPRRIVAAVAPAAEDPEATALAVRVLGLAAGLARQSASELRVVHAWVAIGAHLLRNRGRKEDYAAYVAAAARAASEAVAELVSAVPLPSAVGDQVHVEHGEPESVLPRLMAAFGADLVVIGTRGRNSPLSSVLIPSHARALLERTRCSAVAVPPPRG